MAFCFFFFFFFKFKPLMLTFRDKIYCLWTVHALFMYWTYTIHVFKNIKKWSHGTIHIFKNYFATVFSVFSFSKNNFNPNGPLVWVWIHVSSRCVFLRFFFFRAYMNSNCTVHAHGLLYRDKVHCSCTVYGSHDTIHTFKNYFIIVFLVFSKNKFYPNGLLK